MIAKGAFNNAVWMDGPRQWKSAKLIRLSLHYSARLEKHNKIVALPINMGFQHLPSFVNSRQMFCCFLDHRNQDETYKVFRHAFDADNMFDLLNQENSRHANTSQRHRYGYQAFGQSELGSVEFLVPILVLRLIKLQNLVED